MGHQLHRPRGRLDLHPLASYKFISWSPVTTTRLNFTSAESRVRAPRGGIRNHRLKGRQSVRGWISADLQQHLVVRMGGYTMVAPSSMWASNLTLGADHSNEHQVHGSALTPSTYTFTIQGGLRRLQTAPR